MTLFSLVALADAQGRLLMQERDSATPIDPDRWGLPGGAREGQETALANAVRELEEETGLTGIDLVEMLRATHFHPAIGWFDYAVFGAVADIDERDVRCFEGRQMVFREPEDLWQLDLSPTTARVLPEVLSSAPYATAHGTGLAPTVRRFAGVALLDHGGRILLQERDEHPAIDPERWGLPGGHLEPGEEYEAAAHRELEEETGVRLPPGRLRLWGEFVVDHRAAHGSWDLMQVFAASADLSDSDVDCREGRQMVFVDPLPARELDLTSAASEIVPAFLDSTLYDTLMVTAQEEPT